MKGTTNSKLTSSLKEIVNINLSTNQNDSSDLIGAIITVEYGGSVKNFVWNGEQLNVEVPEGFDYTVSVSEVDNYVTPSPVSYSAEGNSFTSVTFQYLTELVIINISVEDGSSSVGSVIDINGMLFTYNGTPITKKIIYGQTYTITPHDFNNTYSDQVTYTASQSVREINIIYRISFTAGTTFEFDYTGTVQEIFLKKGAYNLQCWGAQGGSVTGPYPASGSKGGYSQGVLTLDKDTNLYVFVGGKGADYKSSDVVSSTSNINGGWNGGGGAARAIEDRGYKFEGTSFPRSGGGATDIAMITSEMKYSDRRTNRSSESLLSRFIVAGGGAGGSSIRKKSKQYTQVFSQTFDYSDYVNAKVSTDVFTLPTGRYLIEVVNDTRKYQNTDLVDNELILYKYTSETSKTRKAGSYNYYLEYYDLVDSLQYQVTTEAFSVPISGSFTIKVSLEKSSTYSTYTSTQEQQGGGTSGKGKYPGTQSSAGSGGGFGYGDNQIEDGYGYSFGSGAGGGGWYGGGSGCSRTSTAYVDYSGGGSGFVNTSTYAKYRPEGYTGLQLASGSTIAGSSSFEAVNGGTEKGHEGNGYARITVLDIIPPEYTIVDYIESTGTQYIDTGFKPDQDTRVVMQAQCLIEGNNYFLFGARTNNSNNNTNSLTYGFNVYNTFYRTHYYNGWKDFSTDIKFTDKFLIDKNKNITTIGGLHTIEHNYTTFKCAYNMYLFASNTADTANTFGKLRLYSCQIYDNETLIRDFVPVKNPDNIVGLYDKKNRIFYSSASSDNFVAGFNNL